MSWLLNVLVVLSVLGVALAQPVERTFTFGINLALDYDTLGADVQHQALIGYTLWQDWWNAKSPQLRTTKGGEVFKVGLHVETFSGYGTHNSSNPGMLFDTYASMFANATIDYFFAPVACPFGVSLRNYSYYALGIPLMICTPLSTRFRCQSAAYVALSHFAPLPRTSNSHSPHILPFPCSASLRLLLATALRQPAFSRPARTAPYLSSLSPRSLHPLPDPSYRSNSHP